MESLPGRSFAPASTLLSSARALNVTIQDHFTEQVAAGNGDQAGLLETVLIL